MQKKFSKIQLTQNKAFELQPSSDVVRLPMDTDIFSQDKNGI